MMGHHHQDGGASKMPCSSEHQNVYSDEASIVLPPVTAGGSAVVRTLQPFDISTNNSQAAGGMATTLGYPFTWAQWKELERQAMIYKYMVSAISVPPDLLLSISTNSSGASHGVFHATLASGSVQGQRYTNVRDVEQGRCKRTDGKKWRCSRDVAPLQKYCERHMHRGRPRSRKHVEVHADVSNASDSKKTRRRPTPMVVPAVPTHAAGQINSHSTKQPLRSTYQQIQGPLLFHDETGENISTDPSFNELHRSSVWMMEGDMVAKANAAQQWQHLMDSSAGFSADGRTHPDLQHGYREEALDLLASRDLESTEDVSVKQNGEFNFMINPESVSMGQQSLKEAPISDLVNSWSNDNIYNNSNDENKEASLWSSLGNISPSSLTLSIAMAAGDALDEDMGLDSRFMNANQHKSWENSWAPFAPGGPLAEALHPSSSYTSNGDSISPAATTVSSPSGVLQKTLLSHSDGSVCNSPILAAPTNITPEMVKFHWPN
ncbi:growth-regulating factor 8 isoform X1 [Capsicum chacoense]